VLLDRLLFRVDYEFTESEFRDVWVGLRRLPWLGTVQFGYMKEPFSLEQATSSRFNTFTERSLVNALVPRRNTGVLATNTLLDGRLRWEAGAFWVVDSFREDDNGSRGFDDDWDLAARVTGLPIYQEGGRRLLLLGLSFHRRFVDSESVSFASSPESRRVDPLISTSDIAAVDSIDTYGLEFAWVDGPFSVQAEIIRSDVERSDGLPDYATQGGYIQASHFLTGERRVYGRASGRWGRVVPKHEFDWNEGHFGALEVAVRFSRLDLDDADVRGGRENNLTLGFSWYPLSNIRVATNAIWGHVSGDGDALIAQARVQVDF
jgi:phosphate-selective porin OprO/OprP